MPTYALEGVAVDFPYEAYDCQLDYMSGVIRALKQGTNALLESPTGTGKTLCLLCATLAWRESLKRERQPAGRGDPTAAGEEEEAGAVEIHRGERGNDAAEATGVRLPAVVYSSRTHSQLAQVMRELRNTSYRPKTAVLASRAQTCQHAEVSQLSGAASNAACTALTTTRSCPWYNRVDEYVKRFPDLNHQPIDIEELVQLGQSGGPCPYFLSKEMATTAELLFVPYNYLIDHRARRSLGSIDWHGAVVIFDEAHNVEGVCADNYSLDITAVSLATAMQEVSRAREIVLMGGVELVGMPDGRGGAAEGGALADELKMLAGVLKAFEEKINDFKVGDAGITRPGEYIFTLLSELQITHATYEVMCEKMEQAADVLVEQALSSGSKRGAKIKNYKISWLSDCLRAIFKTAGGLPGSAGGGAPMHHGFRVHIHRQAVRNGSRTTAAPCVSFWCFYPGMSMNDLASCGIRSVLMTSGTLSPLPSLAHELSLPFPIRLENPHVINPKQVYIGVVAKGPSGVALNSSYQNRDNPRYKTDLGNAIVNFARSTPDGLLVFFPSYGVLQSCIDFWQGAISDGQSIWDRLCIHKHPVIEPRESAAFANAAATFKAKIDDPNCPGAAFFAVCRGKVSEGLDFSDRAGRAVILTGIPYPMKMDPKVRLKQQVLDEEAAKSRRAGGGKTQALLSGNAWYSQQAMRAVNQALGRVIRHRNDYGAVLLCDERFGQEGTRQQLSKWLRDKVAQPPTFGAAAAHLQKFFREMKNNPEVNVVKVTAAGDGTGAAHVAPQPLSTRLPTLDDAKPMDMRGMSQLLESLPAAVDTVVGSSDAAGNPAKSSAVPTKSSSSRLLNVLGGSAPARGAGAGTSATATKSTLSIDSLLGNNDARAQQRQQSATTRLSDRIDSFPRRRGTFAPGSGPPSISRTNLWGSTAAPPVISASDVPASTAPDAGDKKPNPAPPKRLTLPPARSNKHPTQASTGGGTKQAAAKSTVGSATEVVGIKRRSALPNQTAAAPNNKPSDKNPTGALAPRRDNSNNVVAARPTADKTTTGTEAAAPATSDRTAAAVDEKKRAADQASEVMGRLKRVLLREQFVKLFQLVRSYKAKTCKIEALVEYAVATIPPRELESFGLFLPLAGQQMLREKMGGKQ